MINDRYPCTIDALADASQPLCAWDEFSTNASDPFPPVTYCDDARTMGSLSYAALEQMLTDLRGRVAYTWSDGETA